MRMKSYVCYILLKYIQSPKRLVLLCLLDYLSAALT